MDSRLDPASTDFDPKAWNDNRLASLARMPARRPIEVDLLAILGGSK